MDSRTTPVGRLMYRGGQEPVIWRMASLKVSSSTRMKKSIALPARLRSGQRQYRDESSTKGLRLDGRQSVLASLECRKYIGAMSYAGTVKNGVVVLPPGVKLAEGTAVEVVPRDLRVAGDPFLQAIAGVAKRRRHWPRDYALNHGFYVSGEPKKA